MPWYGKDEEETHEEKLEHRIKKLEEDKRRRDNDDTFSMTSNFGGGDD